jgi:hypothetical protein
LKRAAEKPEELDLFLIAVQDSRRTEAACFDHAEFGPVFIGQTAAKRHMHLMTHRPRYAITRTSCPAS